MMQEYQTLNKSAGKCPRFLLKIHSLLCLNVLQVSPQLSLAGNRFQCIPGFESLLIFSITQFLQCALCIGKCRNPSDHVPPVKSIHPFSNTSKSTFGSRVPAIFGRRRGKPWTSHQFIAVPPRCRPQVKNSVVKTVAWICHHFVR